MSRVQTGGQNVVLFGEVLLCFKPSSGQNERCESISCRRDIGGSEFNTAIALATLGRKTRYLSVLPASPLAAPVLAVAEKAGLDMSHVVTDTAPDAEMGTLYLVPNHKEPVYQRLHSSFCRRVDGGDFDWASALRGAGAFCVTGITPALTDAARSSWYHAVKKAAAAKVPIVFDLNWRPSLTNLLHLWGAVKSIIRDVTLLILSYNTLLPLAHIEGLPPPPSQRVLYKGNFEGALGMMQALRSVLKVPLLACCFKESLPSKPGWQQRWSAVVAQGMTTISTQDTQVMHKPKEVLGGGDAWTAGFIDMALEAKWFGLQDGKIPERNRELVAKAARRGDALAALSQERHGDVCMVPRQQLVRVEAALAASTHNLTGMAKRSLPARDQVINAIRSSGVIPVVTITDPSDAEHIGRALAAAGIRVIEITFRTEHAASSIRAVLDAVPTNIVVGAGTVTSKDQVEDAARAGAHFIVSPGIDADVVKEAARQGLPIFPGVATPTDVSQASKLRLEIVKVFPVATLGGVQHLNALSAAFPSMKWIPTGGVTEGNVADYLALPQVLACGGSWLVPEALVKAKDWQGITDLATQCLKELGGRRRKQGKL